MTRIRFITQSALLLACLLASMWVDAHPGYTDCPVTRNGGTCVYTCPHGVITIKNQPRVAGAANCPHKHGPTG